jgi:NTP pyrophosphatase (non-canonical NTP hydrolase)
MKPELKEHLRAHMEWPPFPDEERLRFLCLALCGEAGELAEHVLAYNRGQQVNLIEARKELADIGNYTFMIAELIGINSEPSPSAVYEGSTFMFTSIALWLDTGRLANVVKKDWRGDSGAAERRKKD